MKTSQNLPPVATGAVCLDDGPVPGSAAGQPNPMMQPNLVIENLAELAAAGVPDACQICWADCAALPVPGHDGYRSSSWTLPTAR
jgi:hypothetical protein